MYRWHPGDVDPVQLLNHVYAGGIVVAHNAMFERIAWSFIRDKYKLHHWPELKAAQQRCTMAKAMSMNLPAKLEDLAKVLQTAQQKDSEGAALMKRMAKPRVGKQGDVNWSGSEVEIKRLGDYCDQDVRTEAEIDKLIPDLSHHEQKLWTLDQNINDRGIPLDVPSILRAVDVVEYAKARADLSVRQLTDGKVKRCSEVAKIVEWINSQGVECVSFRKGDHDDIIAASVDKPNIKAVVDLRRNSGKTSTAKFMKMLECVCNDGRIRGQLQYHGATQTGRWAGRLVQPQNLPRIDHERDAWAVQFVIWALNAPMSVADTYEIISMALGNPLKYMSLVLRAMLKAESGYEFFGADFSNIEGRVNAWLAGELWKLEAFRAYDAGTGPDLYKLAYSRSFGKPVEQVGKGTERQIGKVQELALGYQGSVGAFVTMGQTYNLKPQDLVEPVRNASSAELWANVQGDYQSATNKNDLGVEQWTALKIIVNNWRGAHPNITASWYELQDAALQAVNNPNVSVSVYSGRVHYLSDGNFLYCQLPSARVICYPQPHIRYESTEYIEINGTWVEAANYFDFEVELMRKAGAKFKKRNRNVVWFYGIDPETKQWKASYLYGGHQCENIVQATARCILDRAMFAVENAGYPIVLHAHDEILSHVRKGVGSIKHFDQLMNVNEQWLAGLPLAVSSFVDERYVK